MYAGRIVEIGPTDDVLDHPSIPTRIGLLQSVPANVPRGAPLLAIPGMAPPPLQRPSGCPFRERCAFATAICETEPPLDAAGTVAWRCFHPAGEESRMIPLVEARNVSKRFVRELDYAEKLARMLGADTRSPDGSCRRSRGSQDHARRGGRPRRRIRLREVHSWAMLAGIMPPERR